MQLRRMHNTHTNYDPRGSIQRLESREAEVSEGYVVLYLCASDREAYHAAYSR